MRLRATAISLLALLVLASGAHADEYLEEPFEREGFMFGVALGPGGVAGNVGDAGRQRGGGGSVSLRVGTAAGKRLLWLVQLDSVQFLSGAEDSSVTNAHNTFTVAGQYYVLEVLWLKAGIGTATLSESVSDEMAGTRTRTEVSSGMGVMVSSGYDLFRRGSWAIDFESVVGVGLYGSGAVSHIAFRLSANYY